MNDSIDIRVVVLECEGNLKRVIHTSAYKHQAISWLLCNDYIPIDPETYKHKLTNKIAVII
jgi:hypothetical protein